jgi:hypothetical protein
VRDVLRPLTDRPDDERGVVVCERLVLDCCPLCGNDAALVFDWLPWFPIELGARVPELVPEAQAFGFDLRTGAVLAVAAPDDGTDEVEVRCLSTGAVVVVFAADEDVG